MGAFRPERLVIRVTRAV